MYICIYMLSQCILTHREKYIIIYIIENIFIIDLFVKTKVIF